MAWTGMAGLPAQAQTVADGRSAPAVEVNQSVLNRLGPEPNLPRLLLRHLDPPSSAGQPSTTPGSLPGLPLNLAPPSAPPSSAPPSFTNGITLIPPRHHRPADPVVTLRHPHPHGPHGHAAAPPTAPRIAKAAPAAKPAASRKTAAKKAGQASPAIAAAKPPRPVLTAAALPPAPEPAPAFTPTPVETVAAVQPAPPPPSGLLPGAITTTMMAVADAASPAVPPMELPPARTAAPTPPPVQQPAQLAARGDDHPPPPSAAPVIPPTVDTPPPANIPPPVPGKKDKKDGLPTAAPQQQSSLPAASSGVINATPDGGATILFDRDGATLPAEAHSLLGQLAGRMNADDSLQLTLQAYAVGDEDNASKARRLSLSRALAVRSYLIDQGVRSARIEVRALGNKSADGPADRVDILVQKH